MNPLLGLLLGNWRAIALGLAIAIPTAGFWIQTKRLDACQSREEALQATFDAFKAQVQAEGEKAAREAEKRSREEREAKEKADAEYQKNLAALHNDLERMRRERDKARSGSRIVPPSSPGSADPARACFDREALEREVRGSLDRIRERLRALVDEGSEAVTGLNTAKSWAQKR